MRMGPRQYRFFFVLSLAASILSAQTAKIYTSSKAGDRLAAKPDVQFVDAKPSGVVTFEINDAVKHQTMAGFGASIMEAGIIALNTLPADKQEMCFAPCSIPRTGRGTPP
jgi:hypothetical protein